MPARTPEFVPEPSLSRTFTATSSTFLDTPYVLPPIVPATWLPCPFSSVSYIFFVSNAGLVDAKTPGRTHNIIDKILSPHGPSLKLGVGD